MNGSAPPRPKSLVGMAYEALRVDILACRLPPGKKLKIAEIANRFDVSPGAIREALSRLAAEGFVVAEAQRGFRVAPVSQADLDDLTAARIEIESAVMRRAVAHGDVDWESRIVAAYHRLSRTPERAEGDPKRVSDAWGNAHAAFHDALASACDSQWLLHLRRLLYEQSERYRRLSVPAAREERDLPAEHAAIMQAALRHDAEAAVALLARHIATTTRILSTLASADGDRRPGAIRGDRLPERADAV